MSRLPRGTGRDVARREVVVPPLPPLLPPAEEALLVFIIFVGMGESAMVELRARGFVLCQLSWGGGGIGCVARRDNCVIAKVNGVYSWHAKRNGERGSVEKEVRTHLRTPHLIQEGKTRPPENEDHQAIPLPPFSTSASLFVISCYRDEGVPLPPSGTDGDDNTQRKREEQAKRSWPLLETASSSRRVGPKRGLRS